MPGSLDARSLEPDTSPAGTPTYVTDETAAAPTYVADETAGVDGVVVAVPALVLWVLAAGQHVLGAHVVGPLVHHPGPALHADGVAAAEVGAELGAVAAALVVAALEVSVLVEDDLWRRTERKRE